VSWAEVKILIWTDTSILLLQHHSCCHHSYYNSIECSEMPNWLPKTWRELYILGSLPITYLHNAHNAHITSFVRLPRTPIEHRVTNWEKENSVFVYRNKEAGAKTRWVRYTAVHYWLISMLSTPELQGRSAEVVPSWVLHGVMQVCDKLMKQKKRFCRSMRSPNR